MVKNDRSLLRVSGYLFIANALLSGWITWQEWKDPFSPSATFYLSSLFAFVACLLGGSLSLARARRWKPINYRRQMAASSWRFAACVPLATVQLPPDPGALPLPFTIKLKPTWLQVLFAFSLVAAIVLFWNAFFLLAGINPLADRGFLPFMVIGILITLLPFIGLGIVPMLPPQLIEITPDGLTVRHAILSRMGTDWPLRTRKIRWNQVRLFAIRDGKPGEPAMHYELANPYEVVKWKRVRRPRWWSLYRPAIPFAEYDAQMEALIALITGITGLPLYDVR